MSRVSEQVAASMRRDQCFAVAWLDGWILDEVADMVTVKRDHPLNRMRAVFAHLERCPMFEKKYMHGIDSRHRERVVRCFWLKPAFRGGKIAEAVNAGI